MPYPSRYAVHYTVTTHHYLEVDVPEGLRPTGESAAMDVVRNTNPVELRRHEAVSTTAYVLEARALDTVWPEDPQ